VPARWTCGELSAIDEGSASTTDYIPKISTLIAPPSGLSELLGFRAGDRADLVRDVVRLVLQALTELNFSAFRNVDRDFMPRRDLCPRPIHSVCWFSVVA
jgi:hypothetical protein